MSRPRKNPRNNLKKFVLRNFQKKRLTGFKALKNCAGGNFFQIFSWVFPRSTHQGTSIELSLVLFGNLGASEKKFSPIKKTGLSFFHFLPDVGAQFFRCKFRILVPPA